MISGCRQDRSDELLKIQSSMEVSQRSTDSLQEAFRDVPKMILADRRVAEREVTRQLNSWASSRPDNQDWKPTEVLTSLPELITRSAWVENLGKLNFDEPHCDHLFQCQLMNKVTQWVLANPYRDTLFSPWLNEQKGKLPEAEYLQLENALKLFDWSIRNVWVSGEGKSIEQLPINPEFPLRDDGLGYTQLVWQTLVSAHGDAVSRARVFSQLAMQENIPVGWLALPGITPEQYKLWAIGIPVGDQVYLLEPRLGIPVPGPGQVGIATLHDARTDPTVLRRLRVTDVFEYPVSQADLDRVFLVLDLEPMATSRAMSELEKSLTGDLRMKLSVDANEWNRAFRKGDSKMEIKAWSLPWYAQQYAVDLRERLKDMTAFTAGYMTKMGMFIDDTPVSRARLSHLRGSFQTTLDDRGALETYMGLRIDDETLAKLPYDIPLQKELLVTKRRDEDPKVFQTRVQFFQGLFRQSKLQTSLYLAMAHFDLGNYENARSWLDRWMIKLSGTEAWHPISWYLMARCSEMLGETEQAIEYYKKGPSSLEAGNRIRARLLQKSAEAG